MKSLKSRKNNGKELLLRGVSDVIERTHLERALKSGKKLRVKLGIDPTSPDIHIGHSIALRKLRQFQDLGHKAVLIIGDFTGRIGDPSGRSKERKPLSEKEVKANMKHYLAQAGKIIDIKKAEVRYNSEWLEKLDGKKLFEILSFVTMKQILEREDFSKRLMDKKPLGLYETLYPILQSYDSVIVKADVELGGTDQLFNLLAARDLMSKMKMKPQDILTVPLLVGTDGVKKMSKSLGNYIAIGDSSNEMFGKIMSIPDRLIENYFELCTDMSREDIKKAVKQGPRNAKAILAREITAIYHGESAARSAELEFGKVFIKKGLPSRMRTIFAGKTKISAVDMLLLAGMAKSKSDARRLISQGGVRIDGVAASADGGAFAIPQKGVILQAGKHRFARIKK